MTASIHELKALPEPSAVCEVDASVDSFSAAQFAETTEPVILRGLVNSWPVVRAAQEGEAKLAEYILKFDKGAVVPVSVGPASLDGRIFYSNDFTGMNANRGNAKFSDVIARVKNHGDQTPSPLIYLASADVDECMPGFRAENDLDFAGYDPVVSAWIGTKSRIAAHNDLPLNMACVAAGERRFTLFPPEQLPNLYVGPFELTPAGRPVSFVDFAKPDLDRFPRFADALAAAQVADLNAGDALFIPTMWWHHVEAFGSFNFLVNYWWRTVPSYLGTPQDVLTHAMLTIRDLTPEQKSAWREMFNHYVFDFDPAEHEHIPENARGVLAPMTRENARRIRANLLNRLNR